jgi:hypothetical protein
MKERKPIVGIPILTAASIFQISSNLEYLRLSRVDSDVVFSDGSEMKSGATFILGTMNSLIQNLELYRLAVSEIERFRYLIDEFKNKYTKQYAPRKIDAPDKAKLDECIQRISALVCDEIRRKTFFEISFSGGLNYPELISKGIVALFNDEKILKKAPKIVKYDLDEALRCLAYNIPTASAMISLRAVEGALRNYYIKLCGDNRTIKENWKDVLEKVNILLTEQQLENKELVGYLDYIRTVRNKTEHPETTFTKKEAERTLIQCIYAIEEMYHE